jgi:hypothetical protein
MVIVLMATVSCIGPIDCTAPTPTNWECCADRSCTMLSVKNDAGSCIACGQLGQICCVGAKCESARAVCIEDSSSGFGYCRVSDDAPTIDASIEDGGLDALSD